MVIRRRCDHVDSSILAADCVPAEDDSAVCQALTMRRLVRIATPAIVHRIPSSPHAALRDNAAVEGSPKLLSPIRVVDS